MTYDEILRHAWEEYSNGVNAEGSERRRHLQNAMNLLELIPEGYDNRDELMDRIRYML